ncbi:MAG: sigma-70 family RNA polymerase sigma factor [bacterium]
MRKSDKQLIANYFTGDEKSLEILISNYLKPIYSFAYRYLNNSQDAEDATQDVFVKVWKNLKKFDENKKFTTWIFQIAKNTCFDFLKRKKPVLISVFSDFEIPVEPAFLAAAEINSSLEQLPLKYRLIIFLRYNDHFNFREIAEILGEPLNTIKSRHRRALAMLKKLLC